MNETTYPPPVNTPASTPEVPNHLAWAIISTVITTCLCCLPIGIALFLGGVEGFPGGQRAVAQGAAELALLQLVLTQCGLAFAEGCSFLF